MNNDGFDSHKYLSYIGVSYDQGMPSLESLTNILLAHMQVIPFENLDVVMKKTISMKLNDVVDKLITMKRGGYCFEHNILLDVALRSLGYSVTPMLARVLWNKTDIPSPQHVVLVVSIPEESDNTDGEGGVGVEYLVDAAFGGLGSVGKHMSASDSLNCAYTVSL